MLTIREILHATGGELLSAGRGCRVRGVSTDTRTIRKNDLFVAIRGERYDAHDFLARALAAGAGAFLVSRADIQGCGDKPVVLVRDTVRALGLLARFHRQRFKDLPVIGITGSAGKTTTKEMVAAVLKTRYKVLYNKGTENNHIGVPMTLLKLSASHQAAVIEMGTNHPGEISWLASIVEPTVAVYTNIGPSHLEGLGTPAGVLREKSAMVRHMPRGGVVIFNADDKMLARLKDGWGPQRFWSYALDHRARCRACRVTREGAGQTFFIGREKFHLKDPVPGNLYNALAAVSCGRLLDLPYSDIRRGIEAFRTPRGRQFFYRSGKVTVIDDTYNANPVSFKNAVTTLSQVRSSGRRIMVCADMLELGKGALRFHAEAGRLLAESGIGIVLTCGELARTISRHASLGRSILARHYGSPGEILGFLKGSLLPGDVVLVKGSRGMHMECVVQGLLEHLKG
jgi:UDP-N-acetylmuramoyl-tripeptide--D-alanyl-D-alanine ligase